MHVRTQVVAREVSNEWALLRHRERDASWVILTSPSSGWRGSGVVIWMVDPRIANNALV